MTALETKARYRASLLRVGWTVKVRRQNPSPAAPTEASVLARIVDLEVNDFIGNKKQGDRKAIVLADDVAASGIALPLRTTGTDKIVDDGRVYNIQAVDDTSRKYAGVLVAYELLIRGQG